MQEHDLLALCERGVETARNAGAEEAEVMAAYGVGCELSFEKNDLNVATSDDEVTYGVRVIHGGSVGFATSNDPGTLADTVEDALTIARSSVPDANNELPRPRDLVAVTGLFDDAVAGMGVTDITDIGTELLRRIRERDARVSIDSGSVGASETRRAIASSTGVRASEATTAIGGSVFGMAVDGDAVGSFCFDGEYSRRREGFRESLMACADEFVEKSIGALHTHAGESYKGAVLFTPEAVESMLVSNMVAMMGPSAIRKGKTPFTESFGQPIASANLTLRDDGTVAGGIGSSSFDREGLPHAPVDLVKDGVFATILYNHYEAKAAGAAGGSTGHAGGGASSLPSVGTTCLEVVPGTTPLADIEAQAGRCVLMTRFSGNTNPITGEFSGVVKAGYLLKDGEKRAISETLIAGNLLEAFKNCVAISKETKQLYGRSRMPWILVDGISVTAG